MRHEAASTLHSSRLRLHHGAGAATAALGLGVLLGWEAGWDTVTSVFPGFIAMNPLTAVLFVFAGSAVTLVTTADRVLRRVVAFNAALVLGIGVASIAHRLLGLGPALDLMLFREAVASAAPINRMAPTTAGSLMLLGAATLLALRPRTRRLAHWFAIAGGLIALHTWCLYLFAPAGGRTSALVSPMALNTAVGITLLVAGLLAAFPNEGLSRVLHPGASGRLVGRHLLFAAVVVPVGLGWLRLVGERAGLYASEVGVALTTTATVGMLTAAIFIGLEAIERADAQRREAENRLRAHAAEIEDLYHRAPCGYHSLDADGVFVRVNDTELAWLGYARDDLVHRLRFADLLTAEGRRTFDANFPRFKEAGVISGLEFDLVRKDGTTFRAAIDATAVTDHDGNYLMSRSTVFDVTARAAAENEVRTLNAELARRVDELARLNGELEAFSYSVSHDLRAPLRHITGFAALLAREAGTSLNDKSQRFVGVIVDAATTMGQLIDDLLLFSRMGRTEMVRRTVALADVVDDVRREITAQTNGRVIDWQVGELPAVEGDRAMLRVVISNLLWNAVKYTRPRERPVIEVAPAEVSEHEVVLRVRDNGVGFDMAYADRLFGVFQRLHRADEFEGTGIGLASVRRIVSRHGGRTWAEGVVERGATFYVSLPRTREDT